MRIGGGSQAKWEMTTLAFVPPNPKEFDST
jgi:hypothetical protein